MKYNSKLWSILCIVLVFVLLSAYAIPTAVIDPLFHFHSPLENFSYPLDNQRYQNDGIVRHFDYDALITGTSMTENFKTSEFDALFGVNSVKVSYSGGTLPELVSNMEQALEHNPDLKTVLLCIDQWFFFSETELIQANGNYPLYLYDDNLFNDVEYLLNREIFWGNTMEVLNRTRLGLPSTSFDEYSSWVYPYDAEIVLANYSRPEPVAPQPVTEEEIIHLKDMMESTLIRMARTYPDTEFIVYYPPYSILSWDTWIQSGLFPKTLALFQSCSELLLQEENIRLYSFFSDFETVTNLNNYRDRAHHSNQVNSQLLLQLRNDEYRLTKATNLQHWQDLEAFYRDYDYEALLQGR